jgi:hypothetical protein
MSDVNRAFAYLSQPSLASMYVALDLASAIRRSSMPEAAAVLGRNIELLQQLDVPPDVKSVIAAYSTPLVRFSRMDDGSSWGDILMLSPGVRPLSPEQQEANRRAAAAVSAHLPAVTALTRDQLQLCSREMSGPAFDIFFRDNYDAGEFKDNPWARGIGLGAAGRVDLDYKPSPLQKSVRQLAEMRNDKDMLCIAPPVSLGSSGLRGGPRVN